MSRHNRWSGSGGSNDTEGNQQGRYQYIGQTERHHLSRQYSTSRHSQNHPNSSWPAPWDREQQLRRSSDINARQQTEGPGYHGHHYRYSWQDPYFIPQQSSSASSAYAPACDYVVPMTKSQQTAPSSLQIPETPPLDLTTESNSYPQPKVEKQTSPSLEYLETTLEGSTYLDDPTSSRKLLILDLNGTLVFRSPHRRRISSKGGEVDPYADPTAPRPLRPVHPRPFIPSFRQYLFHPQTRWWLDTMIWSSAQPPGVADMVQHCFGDSKDELVAIWARDTLGLSEAEYHRKTQTTKDLTKPWAFLPPLTFPEEPKDSAPASLLPSKISRTGHSAHTTLLLDDSTRKAQLQPWNHICIMEYVAEMRSADVRAAQTMTKSGGASALGIVNENANLGVETQAKGDDAIREETISEDQPTEEQSSTKRKRQLKKMEKKRKKMMCQDLSGEKTIECRTGGSSSKEWWRKFDCSLLAVIGVLDVVKTESNVAAWIRNEGLWRTGKEAEQAAGVDDMSTDLDSDAPTGNASSPSETEAENNDGRKKPRRVSTGKTEELSGDLMRSVKEGLWFEDSPNMLYWVERGIKSLKELDIEVDAGVKVP